MDVCIRPYHRLCGLRADRVLYVSIAAVDGRGVGSETPISRVALWKMLRQSHTGLVQLTRDTLRNKGPGRNAEPANN